MFVMDEMIAVIGVTKNVVMVSVCFSFHSVVVVVVVVRTLSVTKKPLLFLDRYKFFTVTVF